MKIVCDSNMPFAAEAFATLGEVVAKDGRLITADDVRDADLLFTRSTTRIDAALLAGSKVRFYGSAVIGTDHIDIPWLASAGIRWTAAPGCNAESVGTYVACALLRLGELDDTTWAGKTLGIVGVGNVGCRVMAKGLALGMRILACDPPRRRDPADAAAQGFVDLDQLLEEADVLTLHTPLTRTGPDATHHLIDAAAFARLKPGAVVINAARGPVLDTDALLAAMAAGRVRRAVIDCWEGEPAYRVDLMARAILTTPHIAGHAYEGKVNGTRQVYEAACAFLGTPAVYRFDLPPPPVPHLEIDAAGRSDEAVLRELALAVYDIQADSDRLRASCTDDAAARAKAFDLQRGRYPMRRQFEATTVTLHGASPDLLRKTAALGFTSAP